MTIEITKTCIRGYDGSPDIDIWHLYIEANNQAYMMCFFSFKEVWQFLIAENIV